MGNFNVLLYFLKKSATEAYRILVETYNDHTMLEIIYSDWFNHFKNNDFDVEENSALTKRFEDKKL